MMPDHPHDLVAAYPLGVLSDSERQSVEAHLATCGSCRAEVRDLLAVTAAMAQGLDQLTPPPALRARVLAAATATAQETAPPRGEVVDARVPAHVPPPVRHRGAGWTSREWLAAAATVAAVVAGTLAWSFRQDAAATRSEVQALRAQLAAQQQQIATLQTAALDLRRTSSVLTAADLARVDLSGQAPAPVASGRVFWSASQGLVFSATNLPPLPPGRVYQLWVVADGPQSAGIVTPDERGALSVVAASPVPASAKAFALTIEPEGGRPAPTGPMFLLGAI